MELRPYGEDPGNEFHYEGLTTVSAERSRAHNQYERVAVSRKKPPIYIREIA
jgi:hypothetical protein